MPQDGETQRTSFTIAQPVKVNVGDHLVLSNEQEIAIRNQLINNTDDLHDDLRLSIHNNFEQGYYNIAIIQCAILFESWVYSRLKLKLSETQLNKIKHTDKCRCINGIYEVCTGELKDVLGLDFGAIKSSMISIQMY